MLDLGLWRRISGEAGDTLIEVTFALSILGFVLLGSTVVASTAFRTGQTAKERTQVSEAAQAQMEALRSFRDNHTWTEFRSGSALPAFNGIDDVANPGAGTAACTLPVFASLPNARCFHMQPTVVGGGPLEWIPQSGSIAVPTVPTSVIEIGVTAATPNAKRGCSYEFEVAYSFTPLGGGTPAVNHVTTRLANLNYTGVQGNCP